MAPLAASASGKHVALVIGPDDQHRAAVDGRVLQQRAGDALHSQLRNYDVGFEAARCELFPRRRADRADGGPRQGARIARAAHQRIQEPRGRDRRFEHDPVEAIDRSRGAIDRFGIVGRRHAERGRQHCFGAEILERVRQFTRALGRSRQDDALAEQRPRVEPAQVIAQSRHFTHDEQRRVILSRLPGPGRAPAAPPTVPVTVRCDGVRAPINQRGGIVAGPALIDERAEHAGHEPRSRKTHDRAVERRERAPVETRDRIDFVFVTANEHDRIAGVGMRQRNAGVRRGADRHGVRRARLRTECPVRAGTSLPSRRCRT